MSQNLMQNLFDGMNAQWMRERAETQMTLGKMIEALERMLPDATIEGIADAHSYRGYYSDLAFERCAERTKVSEALAMCRKAMGQVFQGYKGGDFVMGALTPIWLASYGCCGNKLISICDDGSFEIADDD